MEEPQLTSVTDLGERQIIDIILKRLEKMPNMPIPYGDDVSAVDLEGGRLAVLKTDMLVGNTDVPLGMSLFQAARKAVVMNVSDLAAKGAKPIALLASIGLARIFTKSDVEQIGDGLNAGAREYNAYVLGGDTSEASDLIISCSTYGIGEKNRMMLREGAGPGDVVAVTGLFGNTSAGLRILVDDLPAPSRMKKTLVDSVLMPRARLKEGLALSKTGAVTASIDSSDGLAWSLYEIAQRSSVGFIINRLPIAPQAEAISKMNGIDPVELCLYGGEEYELVVTVKPKMWAKARRAASLIRIGQVTSEKMQVMKIHGKKIPIETRGWEHFKSNPVLRLRRECF